MTNSTENVAKNVANEKVQDYVKKSHITTENEPKSEKAAQDVQKNCSSLTEKWKNRELEKGWYYIKVYGKVEVARLSKYNQFYNLPVSSGYVANKDIIEVLAPVPSYEDWRKLKEENDKLDEMCHRLSMEETDRTFECFKLKELLKECIPYVMRNVVFTTVNRAEVVDLEKNELLTKIDEVLK